MARGSLQAFLLAAALASYSPQSPAWAASGNEHAFRSRRGSGRARARRWPAGPLRIVKMTLTHSRADMPTQMPMHYPAFENLPVKFRSTSLK